MYLPFAICLAQRWDLERGTLRQGLRRRERGNTTFCHAGPATRWRARAGPADKLSATSAATSFRRVEEDRKPGPVASRARPLRVFSTSHPENYGNPCRSAPPGGPSACPGCGRRSTWARMSPRSRQFCISGATNRGGRPPSRGHVSLNKWRARLRPRAGRALILRPVRRGCHVSPRTV